MSANIPLHAPPTARSRCAYAAYLGTGLLALAFAALACGEGQPLLLVHSALAGTVAALLRAHLAGTGQLAACAEEDDTPVARLPGRSTFGERRAAALLRRSAALEERRGTPRFDPWERLAVRRRLEALRARPRA